MNPANPMSERGFTEIRRVELVSKEYDRLGERRDVLSAVLDNAVLGLW